MTRSGHGITCGQVMFLRFWRLLTIMLTALGLGLAFCHLMELPAKMTYTGALWLKLLQTLYWAFGTIGGAIEVGTVITVVVLAFLVRHRRPAFGWTLLAAICMLTAHAAFWIWIYPVNTALRTVTLATLPADWQTLRDTWEFTHAARAILEIIALGALVYSLLVEIPTTAPEGQP